MGSLTGLHGLFATIATHKPMIDIFVIFVAFVFICAFLLLVYWGCRGRPKAIMIYLGLIVFFIDSSFRLRAEHGGVSLDWQSALKLIIFVGAFAIGIVHSKMYLKRIKSASAFWLLLFILWSICTSVYSPIPQYTFGATFSFLGLFLFALVVTQKLNNRQILYTIAWSMGALIFISWIAFALDLEIAYKLNYSSSGQVKRFSGFGGSPNSMGRFASLFLLILFLNYVYKLARLKKIIAPSIVGGATLFLTWSRSSMLAIVAVVTTFYLRKRPFLLLFCIISIIFLFLYYEVNTSSNIESSIQSLSRSGSVEELYSFTGRMNIWIFVWEKFLQSPVVGYGYAASRVIITGGFSSRWGFTSTTAHNMVLQSLLDTGLIGTLFLGLALVNHGIRWFRKPSPIGGATLVYVLLQGFFESGPIGSIPNLLSFFLILSFFWKDDIHHLKQAPQK